MSLKQPSGEGFVGRWSRLKRDTTAVETPAAPALPSVPIAAPVIEMPGEGLAATSGEAGALQPPAESADRAVTGRDPRLEPTSVLPSIESLGTDSDYSIFMKADVDPDLRLSALKKMFTDPHFNRMDGLDIYIDDYTKPDPIPLAMLKRLNQSRMLNLFEEEPAERGSAARSTESLPEAVQMPQDPAAAGELAGAADPADVEGAADAKPPLGSPDSPVPAPATAPIPVPIASAAPVAAQALPATPRVPERRRDACVGVASVADVASPVPGRSA